MSPGLIDSAHRVVLVRINRKYREGMSEEAIYDATRHYWRVAKKRRRVGSTYAPEWAFAVYKGVVKAVYRIESWEPASDAAVRERPGRDGRWGFRGQRDLGMEARYVGADISDYFRSSKTGGVSRNPIQYVGVRR